MSVLKQYCLRRNIYAEEIASVVLIPEPTLHFVNPIAPIRVGRSFLGSHQPTGGKMYVVNSTGTAWIMEKDNFVRMYEEVPE